MSTKEEYEELLARLSGVFDMQGVELVGLRIPEKVPGPNIEMLYPSTNDNIVLLEITPPIWSRDPLDPGKPPQPQTPPKETVIPVHNEVEKVATVYGIAAGANFFGSPWPDVREEVKSGWQAFCSGHNNIDWESARPHIRHAWDTVSSLFDSYKSFT